MAFNPFNWFRKHQKKLIGIVTIFVMFIFIVQFGKGDFFERALMWVRGPSHKGEVVTTLNGSKVRQGELGQLSRQRSAASMFLLKQASENHSKTADNILKKELKADADATSASLAPLRTIQTSMQMREFFTRSSAGRTPTSPSTPSAWSGRSTRPSSSRQGPCASWARRRASSSMPSPRRRSDSRNSTSSRP